MVENPPNANKSAQDPINACKKVVIITMTPLDVAILAILDPKNKRLVGIEKRLTHLYLFDMIDIARWPNRWWVWVKLL